MSTLIHQHAEFLRSAAASDRRADDARKAGHDMHAAAYRHHAAACRRAAARICAEMVAIDELKDGEPEGGETNDGRLHRAA